jgi:hypothetical protein
LNNGMQICLKADGNPKTISDIQTARSLTWLVSWLEKPDNGVRLVKTKTAPWYPLRAIMERSIFVRAIIGRSRC